VPLKSVDVQLAVRGFVGNVVTTLLYKNTEQNPIEAVFEFPIDDQSAVYQFEAKIEDRIIIAECQEKKQVFELSTVLGSDQRSEFKGELNPKIKLDLNDSFCTLINKYNPHIF